MGHNYTPSAVKLTTVPCPDDGDARNAASVNQAIEPLADAIKFLSVNGPEIASAYAVSTPFTATDPDDDGANTAIYYHTTVGVYSYGSAASPGATLYCDFLSCVAGDIVLVHLDTMLTYPLGAPAVDGALKLFAVEDQGGANTIRQIQGSMRRIRVADIAAGGMPISSHGLHTVVTPGDLRIEYGIAPGDVNVGPVQQFRMTALLYRRG